MIDEEQTTPHSEESPSQRNPQFIKDPVYVNGILYRSTWAAMETLQIGNDSDARRFRLSVKAKGLNYWQHNGQLYRFELKNKRPEQVAAIRAEEELLINIELKASGRITEVFRRDPRAQQLFREMVVKAFGNRCAVTKKRLNGILEAAHIEEAAVDGCYNANNGILLSPTFHKLFDRHQMGIDPDTLKIHFKQGIEYDEYAGRVIDQPLYGLDREHLVVRWMKFLNTK